MNKLVLIFIGFLIVISNAKAEDTAYSVIEKISEVTSKTIDSNRCFIAGSIDFDAYKPYLSVFREEWLNRDNSLDFYAQRSKQVFLFTVVKRYAELLTEGLYRHAGPPQCSFTISIKYLDKLGQPKVIDAVTWKFTQKHVSKVNWIKIDPKNFQEIALDYKFGQQVDEWTADEPSFESPTPPATNCDMRFIRANAIFIRATSFCKKNYMDSPAGYYALAMSRQCAANMTEDEIKSSFMSAAQEVNNAAKKGGKAGACRFIDQVEQEVTKLAVP